MKQISILKTIFAGTATCIILSSFTLAFDDTPFMRAIIDNPADKAETPATSASNTSSAPDKAAEQMLVKWKSVMMSGISRIEEVRQNAEQKLSQNRQQLMELLKTASIDLQHLENAKNSKATSAKLKDVNAKLQAAMQIMDKMGDAELQAELEKLRQTSENASSELQTLQRK